MNLEPQLQPTATLCCRIWSSDVQFSQVVRQGGVGCLRWDQNGKVHQEGICNTLRYVKRAMVYCWRRSLLNILFVSCIQERVINAYRLPRRDEIIIHRLRIGHTFLTHEHLLRGDTRPGCAVCGADLTVEHILLHCVSFASDRECFYNKTVTTLSELFSNVSTRSIIEFIKKTGLYRKIWEGVISWIY